MTTPNTSLYASWEKIYPKYQRGFFRTLKWVILNILLGIYFIVPFLRWDRGTHFPGQMVLFDLPSRKFYILDWVIWPQDIFLLTILLIIMAVGLFFMTTLAGRVFCGYLCFQTVWTDLFLYIEDRVEGRYNLRKKRDTEPWTVAQVGRKVLKHSLWMALSLATGGAFVFYFADAPTLMRGFLDGSAPFPAWSTMLFLTATTYLMAGFAREQVCIYMCPYARFQGAMFDPDTLIVAYDERRGEPRVANRRLRNAQGSGACIHCGECVRVCPTGIDIRDGSQYQCITCAACIDACDSVMDRLHQPRGLVRYTSMRELEGLTTRWLRPRVFYYVAILVAIVAFTAWLMSNRQPVNLNVIKHRSPLYISQSDGSIQNNFTLRVLNITQQDQTYALSVDGLPGAVMSVASVGQLDGSGRPVLHAQPGQIVPYTVYVRRHSQPTGQGQQKFTFILAGQNHQGGEARYETVFSAP